MQTKLQIGKLAKKENRECIANSLGWFSIGLGLAEFLMPRTLWRLIGIKPRPVLARLLGLREIASGVGLLTQSEKGPWLKARVVGDGMDLALLGLAATSGRSKAGKLAFATAAVAGVTAVDFLCYKDFADGQPEPGTREFAMSPEIVHFRRSLVINRRAEQLYQIWRKFDELPRYMRNVVSVENRGDNRWHWTTRGAAGAEVEWDAEVTEDKPNEAIAWKSLPGGDVTHTGSVQFERAPGNRGTIVRVEMRYRAPAGKQGAIIAKLLGKSPEHQIAADLLRFKQMLEAGEMARTEGQPAGRTRSTSRKYDDLVRA